MYKGGIQLYDKSQTIRVAENSVGRLEAGGPKHANVLIDT